MGKECRTNLRISLVWPILKMSANTLAAWDSSIILYSYVCTVVVRKRRRPMQKGKAKGGCDVSETWSKWRLFYTRNFGDGWFIRVNEWMIALASEK